ncbi:hypothetical protein HU200_041125 [Digitaria exilis]|uniref:EXPERA domain-containing protein n=1 Tax=Digitaria exilis TaxID=1010633 RepID=A0A835EID4_9POAL|nr:hypothetical protein HU200_041125 [Digitaria exilis]
MGDGDGSDGAEMLPSLGRREFATTMEAPGIGLEKGTGELGERASGSGSGKTGEWVRGGLAAAAWNPPVPPHNRPAMAVVSVAVDAVVVLFSLTMAVAAPLFDSQVVLPASLYPAPLLDLFRWFVAEFDHYVVADPPPFFRGLVWIDLAFLWPVSVANLYGILTRRRWSATTSLMAGVHMLTYLLLGSGRAKGKLLLLYALFNCAWPLFVLNTGYNGRFVTCTFFSEEEGLGRRSIPDQLLVGFYPGFVVVWWGVQLSYNGSHSSSRSTPPANSLTMGIISAAADALIAVFSLTIAVAAPLIDGQSVLPHDLYPARLVELKGWYAAEFGDYLMARPPAFFRGIVWLELAFLWPLSVATLYGILTRRRWVATTSLMAGVATLTSMLRSR